MSRLKPPLHYLGTIKTPAASTTTAQLRIDPSYCGQCAPRILRRTDLLMEKFAIRSGELGKQQSVVTQLEKHNTNVFIDTRPHTRARVHTHTHTLTHARTQTHARTRARAHTHTHRGARGAHTSLSLTHTHTHTRARMHTYRQTYACAHIQILNTTSL